MKEKEKKVIFTDIVLDEKGNESSLREVLIERLRFESYFSPKEIRFVESSQSSN